MDHSVVLFVGVASYRSIAEKQFQTVQLIHFARTGVIVYSGYVRTRIPSAQFLYHAFSGHMVRKTGKRLHTGNTRTPGMNELNHLGGKEPSFTSDVSKLDNIIHPLHKIVDY